jgi:hypothetical protein
MGVGSGVCEILRSSLGDGTVSPLTITVGGGGVASRIGPPVCCGTCNESLCGRLEVALCGGGMSGGTDSSAIISCGAGEVPVLGLEGNVENGPSCVVLDAGGLPLALAPGGFCEGQAEDTAGPCRRRLFVDGVIADMGSSANAESICDAIEPPGKAVIGCGVAGVSDDAGLPCHLMCGGIEGVTAD